MKIQLDTTNKTIKVEDNIKMGEFINQIKKFLPNGLWKEFTLETSTIINWSNPIVIEPYTPKYPYPWIYPTWQTYTAGSDTQLLNEGVYNIEL